MAYGPPWKPEFQPLSQGRWICTNRILGFRQSSLNHRIQVSTSRQSLWLSYRSPSSPCYCPLPLSSSGRANDLAGLPLLPPDCQAKRSSRYTAHPAFHHIGFRAQEPLPHAATLLCENGRRTKKGPPLGPLSNAQTRVCAKTTAILPGHRSDVKIHGVYLDSYAESHDSHDSIQSHGTGCHGKTPKGRRSAVPERDQPGCSEEGQTLPH